MTDEKMQKYKEYQKNYQKMYLEKKAKKNHKLKNIKKAEVDLVKNAVLTPPKIKSNFVHIKLLRMFYH